MLFNKPIGDLSSRYNGGLKEQIRLYIGRSKIKPLKGTSKNLTGASQ